MYECLFDFILEKIKISPFDEANTGIDANDGKNMVLFSIEIFFRSLRSFTLHYSLYLVRFISISISNQCQFMANMYLKKIYGSTVHYVNSTLQRVGNTQPIPGIIKWKKYTVFFSSNLIKSPTHLFLSVSLLFRHIWSCLSFYIFEL